MTLAWQHSREGGGHLAIWLIRAAGLYLGRGFARAALYPITLYFFLRRREEGRCIGEFYRRIQGRLGSARQILHQIHWFACVTLDRVFLLHDGLGRFAIEVHGEAMLRERLATGRGVLLLGTHYGSFDALRALSSANSEVRLHVVLDKQQTPWLTQLLEELAPDIARDAIDISEGVLPAMLAMSEAAQAGHMVGLLADRARAGEGVREVPFLGSPAPFPVGPWQLAASLGVPVVLCFGSYLGGNRYRLDFELFDERVTLPRRERDAALDEVIGRYAARLEHHVREHPDNWFNFYDFWQPPLAAPEPREARA